MDDVQIKYWLNIAFVFIALFFVMDLLLVGVSDNKISPEIRTYLDGKAFLFSGEVWFSIVSNTSAVIEFIIILFIFLLIFYAPLLKFNQFRSFLNRIRISEAIKLFSIILLVVLLIYSALRSQRGADAFVAFILVVAEMIYLGIYVFAIARLELSDKWINLVKGIFWGLLCIFFLLAFSSLHDVLYLFLIALILIPYALIMITKTRFNKIIWNQAFSEYKDYSNLSRQEYLQKIPDLGILLEYVPKTEGWLIKKRKLLSSPAGFVLSQIKYHMRFMSSAKFSEAVGIFCDLENIYDLDVRSKHELIVNAGVKIIKLKDDYWDLNQKATHYFGEYLLNQIVKNIGLVVSIIIAALPLTYQLLKLAFPEFPWPI